MNSMGCTLHHQLGWPRRRWRMVKKHLRRQRRAGTWANVASVWALSHHLRVPICVHDGTTQHVVGMQYGGFALHLRLENNHYTPVLEDQIIGIPKTVVEDDNDWLTNGSLVAGGKQARSRSRPRPSGASTSSRGSTGAAPTAPAAADAEEEKGANDPEEEVEADHLEVCLGDPLHTVSTITVIRCAYNWKQAFNQRNLGWVFRCDSPRPGAAIRTYFAKFWKVGEQRVEFTSSKGRLITQADSIVDGDFIVVKSIRPHVPAATEPAPLPNGPAQPASFGELAQPAGTIDLEEDGAELAEPEHQPPTRASHTTYGEDPLTSDEGAGADCAHAVKGQVPEAEQPVLRLRLPSIYAAPLRVPRAVWSLPVRHFAQLKIQVEAGSYAQDYAEFGMRFRRMDAVVQGPLQITDEVELTHLETSRHLASSQPMALLEGGGLSRLARCSTGTDYLMLLLAGGEALDQDFAKRYNKAVQLVRKRAHYGWSNFQVRAILRCEPRLVDQILRDAAEHRDNMVKVAKKLGMQQPTPVKRSTSAPRSSTSRQTAAEDMRTSTGQQRAQSAPRQQQSSAANHDRSDTGRGNKGHPTSRSTTRSSQDGQRHSAGKGKDKGRGHSTTAPVIHEKPTWRLAGKWNVPVQTSWRCDMAGVHATESEISLRQWASEAFHSQHPIAVVAPVKVQNLDVGMMPPREITVEVVKVTEQGEQPQRLRAFLYNLTTSNVVQLQTMKALQLRTSVDDTLVTSVQIETAALDAAARTQLQSKVRGEAIAELRKYLPRELQQSVLDAWRATLRGTTLSMLIRLRTSVLPAALRYSGQRGIWIDVPFAHREQWRILWLKDGFGEHKRLYTKEEAIAYLQELPDHGGLIQKDDTFGIRVSKELSDAKRPELNLTPGDAYFLKGAPISLSVEDLQDLVDQIPWTDARLQVRSMTARGKLAQWKIRALADPPVWAVPVQCGADWHTLRFEKAPLTTHTGRGGAKDESAGHMSFLGALMGTNKKQPAPVQLGKSGGKGKGQSVPRATSCNDLPADASMTDVEASRKRSQVWEPAAVNKCQRNGENDDESASDDDLGAADWNTSHVDAVRSHFEERLREQQMATQQLVKASMQELWQQVQADLAQMLQQLKPQGLSPPPSGASDTQAQQAQPVAAS